jgi:hypothetical protein
MKADDQPSIDQGLCSDLLGVFRKRGYLVPPRAPWQRDPSLACKK